MSGITGTQAFLAASGGIPIKEPILDNQPLGDFWVRKDQYISANMAMVFSIQLPRVPSVFIATTTDGAVVYATKADRALWSPTQIVVRASISTSADLIVG